MATAKEFLDREDASWAAFAEQVERVPEDRRETPGVVGQWTLKDVVWHCVYWARFAADHLVKEGDGPYTDPFAGQPDEHWDAVNAEIAEASSAMSWDDVWSGTAEAREVLRHAIVRPGLPPEPVDFAAEESWVHYDEHGAEVRAFADALGR